MRRPVAQTPYEAQARPCGIDRADLVVDESLGQADLAYEVLVEVGGHAGAALRPRDPEPARRLQRGRERREAGTYGGRVGSEQERDVDGTRTLSQRLDSGRQLAQRGAEIFG